MTNGLAKTADVASPPLADLEAGDRERVARMAASTLGRGAAPRLRRGSETTEPRVFAAGWKMSLILDILLIASPLPLVLVVPPFLECWDRQAHVGFFAGESVGTCSRKGISERWNKLDNRLKMLVRDSGH